MGTPELRKCVAPDVAYAMALCDAGIEIAIGVNPGRTNNRHSREGAGNRALSSRKVRQVAYVEIVPDPAAGQERAQLLY